MSVFSKACCFMVNEQVKVPSDDYFIFTIKKMTRSMGFISHQSTSRQSSLRFNCMLCGMGLYIIVFAATIDGKGTFADAKGSKITARTASAELVYEIREANAETSLVLGELYRHQAWFKLRAHRSRLQWRAEAAGGSIWRSCGRTGGAS